MEANAASIVAYRSSVSSALFWSILVLAIFAIVVSLLFDRMVSANLALQARIIRHGIIANMNRKVLV